MMFTFSSRGIARLLIVFTAVVVCFSSCVSPKKVVYLNSIKDSYSISKPYIIDSVTSFVNPKILTSDLLLVVIQTDLQSTSSSNPLQQARMGLDPYLAYLVDKNGNVELPLVGFIHVAGLTTAEARELIKEKAKEFYQNPVINVRILNFDVYYLGEFGQRKATFPNEKVNILEAVAEGGDIALTGKRKNILMIRTEGDTKKLIRFDLTGTDFFHSPYFYLRQRDMLYAEPTKFKVQASDNTLVRNIGIVSALASMLTLALSFRALK